MRNNFKTYTRFAGTPSCTTTTLAWHFGGDADPFISCPVGQLGMWCQVWVAAPTPDKQDARFTWFKHQVKLLEQDALRNICGPAAATIAALVDICWKPIRPDFWAVDELTTVKLDQLPFTRL